MKPEEARNKMVCRLTQDLVGPLKEDEVISGAMASKPSDVYLTGMLWPMGSRMGAEDDDESQGGEGEEEQSPITATIVGQHRPCSMGLSFASTADSQKHLFTAKIRFGTYTYDENVEDGIWIRTQHEFLEDIELPRQDNCSLKLQRMNLDADVELSCRTVQSKYGLLTTMTLINRSCLEDGDASLFEKNTLFQTAIEITPSSGTKIVARPPHSLTQDSDVLSGKLLYRNAREFATGHQCSAEWETEGETAKFVRSTWLPQTTVPSYREDGDPIFASLIEDELFSAECLAQEKDPELLCDKLFRLPETYRQWIETRKNELSLLPPDLMGIAQSHLTQCINVCDRMQDGVEAIKNDAHLRQAFQYSNAAMSLQHSWKQSPGKTNPLNWRPFQLGFILLAAESACRPDSDARDILDLLWFPTGGGKTEAYLAIIGMSAWYRRLAANKADEGAGNVAIMRYTLRLLTAQQFQRAAAMILACELIRQGKYLTTDATGSVPFSIGLWVGKDATPNKYEDAEASRGRREGSSAEQLEECPCCGERVSWDYDGRKKAVRPFCQKEDCLLAEDKLGLWPIYTVDSDIYIQKPTLLIGTVDKFAQLPFNKDMADLFGFGKATSTDLIIQDELHLISGPLGTLTGLYETAFDWLLRKGNRRPKIIGSTATIRRAEQQIAALFDRRSCQFPPPGLSSDNSGFAVVDKTKPGRLYVGVSTAGRSAKFTLQAAVGSLLQAGSPFGGIDDEVRDGYSTLLCYFNSLRELGGAIVQMLDDVPASIALYANKRLEKQRTIDFPLELTSRVTQKEISGMLDRLKRTIKDSQTVDVVLATNMVSVGVDVPRLGLMVVNGQPKSRSEYIQSTSRVGRSTSPGLIVSLLNASKPRDRSHFESFCSWHSLLYRDVEATSVTPFAPRSRDRALHAVLVSMLRHGHYSLSQRPVLANAPDVFIQEVVAEIERRVDRIDHRELKETQSELDEKLRDWEGREPKQYLQPYRPKESLMQYAESYASKIAAGRLPGEAWPTVNTMRSVEPAAKFKLIDYQRSSRRTTGGQQASDSPSSQAPEKLPRWRKSNG